MLILQRVLLTVLSLTVAVGGWSEDRQSGEEVSGDALNVIIISVDTLRADHLGCYGYAKPTSPRIDALAAQSVVFRNSFANSNWTLPSHMSLMTSLYSTEHDVTDKTNRLSSRIPTLAEVLSSHGYRTVAFTAGYFVDRKFGFDRGFDRYEQEYDARRENSGQGWRLMHLEDDLFKWLDQNNKEKFFLFVHSYDVHEPFIAHDHLSTFSPDYQGPLTILHNMADFTKSAEFTRFKKEHGGRYFDINLFYQKVINSGKIEMSMADVEHIVALYDNEILFADGYVGRILDKLKELSLDENTVVVLWSDHGEELLERGQISHGARMYDELLRVPLIIRIPGREPAVVDTLAQGIDVAPTILEILGLPPERSFAGKALLAPEVENPYIIAEDRREMCIRSAQHKLVVSKDLESYTLYDLAADPGETKDVATDNPEVVAGLRAQLFEALNIVDVDDELRRRLESLGYIE